MLQLDRPSLLEYGPHVNSNDRSIGVHAEADKLEAVGCQPASVEDQAKNVTNKSNEIKNRRGRQKPWQEKAKGEKSKPKKSLGCGLSAREEKSPQRIHHWCGAVTSRSISKILRAQQ